jgi:hypothetical protein
MESSDPKDNNFHFSSSELNLITDRSFFIRKAAILSKVQQLFANLEEQISDIQLFNIPMELDENKRGKISQGEKYLGAPWMVLDKPAYFSGNDIFAFRHMFLWGHSFTTSFHMAGQFKGRAANKNIKKLYGKNRFLLVGPDPFVHHYSENSHIAIEDVDESTLEQLPYFKIAEFTELSAPESFSEKCVNFVKDVDEFLKRY